MRADVIPLSPLFRGERVGGGGRRLGRRAGLPLTLTLVTSVYPTRLLGMSRWRAGARQTRGPLRPWESLAPRPSFHRTRTVAGAARRARLGKDGSLWTRSPLVSTSPRIAWTSLCVPVERRS